jgi:thioredoxin 1
MIFHVNTLLLLWCCYFYQSYAFLFNPKSYRLFTYQQKLFDVKEITSALEFDQFITQQTDPNNIKVVDFKKSKCAPCIKVLPHYIELSNKFKDRVLFYSVDADECAEGRAIMKVQGIRSVPTFHIYKGSERVESIQGTHMDEVEEAIENELKILNKS